MSNTPGTLFVVATPIGNLEDLSPRARRVLGEAELIAAEDTRHSRILLERFSISTRAVAYHDHNERTAAPALLDRLRRGDDIALISDAGTPLISDPGYRLVSLAHDAGIPVVAVPGPSALVGALSVSGLPVHRFSFEGYPPERAPARREWLQRLKGESRTLVFFEAPHRLREFISDCAAVFGPDRKCAIARELTKKHESVRRDSLGGLLEWIDADPDHRRGEMVVVVGGAVPGSGPEEAPFRLLRILLRHLPVKDAAAVAAEVTGIGKNRLYKMALDLKESGE